MDISSKTYKITLQIGNNEKKHNFIKCHKAKACFKADTFKIVNILKVR